MTDVKDNIVKILINILVKNIINMIMKKFISIIKIIIIKIIIIKMIFIKILMSIMKNLTVTNPRTRSRWST